MPRRRKVAKRRARPAESSPFPTEPLPTEPSPTEPLPTEPSPTHNKVVREHDQEDHPAHRRVQESEPTLSIPTHVNIPISLYALNSPQSPRFPMRHEQDARPPSYLEPNADENIELPNLNLGRSEYNRCLAKVYEEGMQRVHRSIRKHASFHWAMELTSERHKIKIQAGLARNEWKNLSHWNFASVEEFCTESGVLRRHAEKLPKAWALLVPSDNLTKSRIESALDLLIAIVQCKKHKPSQIPIKVRVSVDDTAKKIFEACLGQVTPSGFDATNLPWILRYIFRSTDASYRSHAIAILLEAAIDTEGPTKALERLTWCSKMCGGRLSLSSLTDAEQANIITTLIRYLSNLWLGKSTTQFKESQLKAASNFASSLFAYIGPGLSIHGLPDLFCEILELLDNDLLYLFWWVLFATQSEQDSDSWAASFHKRAITTLFHNSNERVERRVLFFLSYLRVLLKDTDEQLVPRVMLETLLPRHPNQNALIDVLVNLDLPIARIEEILPDFLPNQ
ncbi:MAG: hypothetical protein M1828_007014 [Chrysothrix sp. TS-e1954]|nr:MAG: hypothetical protein M1828_007014 [Chrysothrix sp. TS-e1954]